MEAAEAGIEERHRGRASTGKSLGGGGRRGLEKERKVREKNNEEEAEKRAFPAAPLAAIATAMGMPNATAAAPSESESESEDCG